MGYENPLITLPALQELMELPIEDRRRIAKVFRDLRQQANAEAEKAWGNRKGPMAAYYRAMSTYSRHFAHALEKKP